MTQVLRITFALLGLSALTIGTMIFLQGPQAFVVLLHVAIPSTPPVEGLGGVNIDNEMRFYATLWIAYGAIAIQVARALPARMSWMRGMLAVFMLGGVGRALSWAAFGAPHPLFTVLMWIELLLPPVLIALSFYRPHSPAGDRKT